MRTTAAVTIPRLAARGRRSLHPTTAVAARSDPCLHRALLDERREPGEHLGVCLRKNAVAEIEDVAGAAARPLEHVEHRRLDPLPRGEQDRGIEVALNGMRQLPPGLERHPPVEPEHVTARAREA